MDGDQTQPPLQVTPAQASLLPNDAGHPSALVLIHGSLEVRWYRPDPAETHLPHDRDELYFVVSGRARFRRINEPDPFDEEKYGLAGQSIVDVAPGDVLFAPAGAFHCFEQATPDFAAWAVFSGPEGGELP